MLNVLWRQFSIIPAKSTPDPYQWLTFPSPSTTNQTATQPLTTNQQTATSPPSNHTVATVPSSNQNVTKSSAANQNVLTLLPANGVAVWWPAFQSPLTGANYCLFGNKWSSYLAPGESLNAQSLSPALDLPWSFTNVRYRANNMYKKMGEKVTAHEYMRTQQSTLAKPCRGI